MSSYDESGAEFRPQARRRGGLSCGFWLIVGALLIVWLLRSGPQERIADPDRTMPPDRTMSGAITDHFDIPSERSAPRADRDDWAIENLEGSPTQSNDGVTVEFPSNDRRRDGDSTTKGDWEIEELPGEGSQPNTHFCRGWRGLSDPSQAKENSQRRLGSRDEMIDGSFALQTRLTVRNHSTGGDSQVL